MVSSKQHTSTTILCDTSLLSSSDVGKHRQYPQALWKDIPDSVNVNVLSHNVENVDKIIFQLVYV